MAHQSYVPWKIINQGVWVFSNQMAKRRTTTDLHSVPLGSHFPLFKHVSPGCVHLKPEKKGKIPIRNKILATKHSSISSVNGHMFANLLTLWSLSLGWSAICPFMILKYPQIPDGQRLISMDGWVDVSERASNISDLLHSGPWVLLTNCIGGGKI